MTLSPLGSVSRVKSMRSSGLLPAGAFVACAAAFAATRHNRETARERSLISPPLAFDCVGWTGTDTGRTKLGTNIVVGKSVCDFLTGENLCCPLPARRQSLPAAY